MAENAPHEAVVENRHQYHCGLLRSFQSVAFQDKSSGTGITPSTVLLTLQTRALSKSWIKSAKFCGIGDCVSRLG